MNKRASSLDRMTKEIDSIHGKINVLARSSCTVKDKVYDVIDAEIQKQKKKSRDSDTDSLAQEEQSDQLGLNEGSPGLKKDLEDSSTRNCTDMRQFESLFKPVDSDLSFSKRLLI